MIGEICAEIKNYFAYPEDRHIGDWVISNGIITPSLDIPTNYIRIVGSRLNDGVHKVSEMQLQDESFHGGIWIMSPPKDFLLLVSEIQAWQATNGAADSHAMSPFDSESLVGIYSYSKSTGTGAESQTGASWQNAYNSRLKQYRRLREL